MSGASDQPESARSRLARHVRALRRERDLSQEVLGELARLHRTYIGSVERKERNVSLDCIERLAQALDVDVSTLLSPGSEAKPESTSA